MTSVSFLQATSLATGRLRKQIEDSSAILSDASVSREELDIYISRYRTVKAKGKELVQLVFDRTPFYGESGGQVGDIGVLESTEEKIDILNTIKENDLIIHITDQLPKNPTLKFRPKIDTTKRLATTNNHTATHLLHAALRHVLGTHVEQKGSLVTPNYLRFDFSHFQKVTNKELRYIEQFINEKIRENKPRIENRAIPITEALKLGAVALFGEKYGDIVRVIRYGNSIELCGVTHAAATGQIGIFKIMSESAIAAGIRRIEAVTGEKAENIIYETVDTLKQIRQLFNNSPTFMQAIKKALNENQELHKQFESLMQQKLTLIKQQLINNIEVDNGINIIKAVLPFEVDRLKNIINEMRRERKNLIIVIGSEANNKPTLIVALSDDLVAAGKNAVKIIREAAVEICGSGSLQ